MIKYGVLLPWTGQPRLGVCREYPLSPEDYRSSATEMDRWVDEEFAEEIAEVEARRAILVVSGFVVHGGQVAGCDRLYRAKRGAWGPKIPDGHSGRPGTTTAAGQLAYQGGCVGCLLSPAAAMMRQRQVAVSNRGSVLQTASPQLRTLGRALVVYKFPPTCHPRATSTRSSDNLVLGRYFRCTTNRVCGHPGESSRRRKGGPRKSKSVCGFGLETASYQDQLLGETRPGAAWYCGRHSSAALPLVPRKIAQDLPSGPTIPQRLHSTQTTMLPPRRAKVLWTGQFCESRGLRRSPLPAGALQLYKRRHPKPARDIVSPKFAGLDLVGKPPHKPSCGTGNLGRIPGRDLGDRRIHGRLGSGYALPWKGEREHTTHDGLRVTNRPTSKLWDIRTSTGAVHAYGCRTRLHQPEVAARGYIGTQNVPTRGKITARQVGIRFSSRARGREKLDQPFTKDHRSTKDFAGTVRREWHLTGTAVHSKRLEHLGRQVESLPPLLRLGANSIFPRLNTESVYFTNLLSSLCASRNCRPLYSPLPFPRRHRGPRPSGKATTTNGRRDAVAGRDGRHARYPHTRTSGPRATPPLSCPVGRRSGYPRLAGAALAPAGAPGRLGNVFLGGPCVAAGTSHRTRAVLRGIHLVRTTAGLQSSAAGNFYQQGYSAGLTRFGGSPEGRSAAFLLAQEHAETTSYSYACKWARFIAFCGTARCPVSASVETVGCTWATCFARDVSLAPPFGRTSPRFALCILGQDFHHQPKTRLSCRCARDTPGRHWFAFRPVLALWHCLPFWDFSRSRAPCD
jgi:hypothetical protein